MRSQNRHKRSRHNNKDHDGDVYMNAQGEDHHSEVYSRSHNTLETYRAASTSTRGSYVSERERSGHSRHEEDWHRPSYDDRYQYDHYPRGDRLDEYEDGRKDGRTWSKVDPPPYPPAQHDWPHSYDVGGGSGYPEPSPWDPPGDYAGSRASYVSHWSERENRELGGDDWDVTVTRNDRVHERRQDWRHEGRRDKNSPQTFQADSGWGNRRREREWAQDTPAQSETNRSLEDRQWEPAESWKSSNRNTQPQFSAQQNQSNTQQKQNGQRNNGKSKRNRDQQKQRREWRQSDDGDLNNWTRREPLQSTSKSSSSQTLSKRKHARSTSGSRSRSRSPAESYTSHPSFRGRSRSPSVSPVSKRRRREGLSPGTRHSQTPSEQDTHRPYQKYFSRSRSPHRSPSGRRNSLSQGSSTGSDRSRSRSPAGQQRALHRLPLPSQAGSLPVIESGLSHPSTNGVSNRKGEEFATSHKNGKSRWNKREKKNRDKTEPPKKDPSKRPTHIAAGANAVPIDGTSQHISISMPPPAIPSSLPTRLRPSEQASISSIETRTEAVPPRGGRGLSIKGAGFKPIGKASSSIKKFFPGDDDDVEVATSVEIDKSTVAEDSATIILAGPSIEESQPLPRADPRSWWPEGPHTVSKPNSSLTTRHLGPVESHQIPLRSSIRPSHSWTGPSLDSLEDQQSQNQISHTSMWPLRGHSVVRSEDIIPLQPNHAYAQPTPPTAGTLKPAEPHSSPAPSAMSIDPDSSPREAPETHQTSATASLPKDLYSIVNQVGEGTFGMVYKARNSLTGGYVALKRIRMESERDGFPVTAMREIKLLQSLRHDNVVRLYEMMVSKGAVHMVFEYMDHDLTGILSQSQFQFTDAHLKSLCYQMLAGLAYLHQKGVIHRDIKGSNILVNNRGELKLADFGLARFYQKRRRADYTNRVITLWYRPPELLFGATVYGPEVDMWSAGCIMLELFTKKPVFQGNDELHQVEVVFKFLGSPTLERWPDAMNLPWYELVKPLQPIPNRFRDAFQKWLSPAALDLAERLLEYDPKRRITAVQAMEAPYFKSEAPEASLPTGLANLEGEWHELESKRERAKRKERKNPTSC